MTLAFIPCAESVLLVSWGNRIDPLLHAQVQALYEALRARALPGILDYIPAYSTLAIVLDLAYFDQHYPGHAALHVAQTWVEDTLRALPAGPRVALPARRLRIPVCYEPEYGPDLLTLAAQLEMRPAELVALHTATDYQVYMLGFLPGFAYMGILDEQIAAPRLPRPRRLAPAGSVGIAGRQTGIYPLDSPGGWNLIGRTPLRMFDAARAEPVYLRPGDEITFYPVSSAEFDQIAQSP
ncbi:MAG: 5-oxoprolinase subunit PxpB [Saprospiraceae bacterium]